MRVALVSHYTPPQPAIASHRILRLTRALLAAGHEVHWVTLDSEQLPKSDATLAARIPPEVQVHGLGGPTLYSLPAAPTFWTKVQRTLAYELPKRWPLFDGHFEWTRRLKRSLPRIVRDHAIEAVLICCSPHGQIAALRQLDRMRERPQLFVDYRDLLSGNPWNEHPDPKHRARLRKRERRALSHADVLFLNTADARDRFTEVVGPIDGVEIDVMRNAADYELADAVFAADPVPDLGPGAHVGFFGTLFPQRRLREFLAALATLDPADRDLVTLHVYCDARQSKRLLDEDLAACDPATASRVQRHDFLPWGDAIRAMRAMHALALVNSPDERDVVFVPGKLYDYVMARRPILFVGAAGDASRIVEATGGSAFDYADQAGLAAALRALARTDAPALTAANADYAPAASFAPLLDRLSKG